MNQQERRTAENMIKYLESIKLTNGKNLSGITVFRQYLLNDYLIHKEFKRNKKLRQHIRRMAVVHSVSLLEVHLRNFIVSNKKHWTESGINELLKDKITLSEAFELFKHPDLKQLEKVHLIAHSSSFQSVGGVDTILSTLYGFPNNKGFLKDFEIRQNRTDDNWLYGVNIIKTFYSLFEIRNKIVHECNEDDIDEYNFYELTMFPLKFMLLIELDALNKEFTKMSFEEQKI